MIMLEPESSKVFESLDGLLYNIIVRVSKAIAYTTQPPLSSPLSPPSLFPLFLVRLSMLRSSSGTLVAVGSGVVKWLGGLLSRGQVTAEEAFLCIYADS